MTQFDLKSSMPRMAFPAVPSPDHAQIIAALWQLEQSQWLTPVQLARRQSYQFAQLMRHAQQVVPFYKDRLQHLGTKKRPLNNASFREIPLLTRSEIQLNHDALLATELPAGHGMAGTTETSGSTGQSVRITKSRVNQLFFHALALREHAWHRRDFKAPIAAIRANEKATPPEGTKDWGPPLSGMFVTGPCHQLPINTPIQQQVEWLNTINPAYLLTYPNNLQELLRAAAEGLLKLTNLKQVRTLGETLKPELRGSCLKLLGAPIIDAYSSQEIGTIATQCPESGLYHNQETALVEVLREDGSPCKAGETGRIVITDLTNFAMPLIRYEIRDYAQVGPACSCGRGLPTLQQIMGRQRNMLVLPNGDRHWPLVGFQQYERIADVRQFQFIQLSLTDIDVHLVLPAPLTAAQRQELTAVMHTALGHPFKLNFIEHETELPRTSGGKFEEFVCMVS